MNKTFLVKKVISNILAIRGFFVNLDIRLVASTVFLNFFNMFGIFFFEDFFRGCKPPIHS